MDVAGITILGVNAAQGLSLGLSVVVLVDVLPWRHRHLEWMAAIALVACWLPFALSGSAEVRRLGGIAISLYLSSLFVAYARKQNRRDTERATEARRASESRAVSDAISHTCAVRLRGDCVPAPRRPLDDQIGKSA